MLHSVLAEDLQRRGVFMMNEHVQEGISSLAAPAPAQDYKTLWRQRQLQKAQTLIALMQSWRAEDAAEDQEKLAADWEAFQKALNEDRPSNRKLFPRLV
jgi:hypothetical protein